MERFTFEYDNGTLSHKIETEDKAVRIEEVVERFKIFLRGLYSAKLVDNIHYLGPECK